MLEQPSSCCLAGYLDDNEGCQVDNECCQDEKEYYEAGSVDEY